MPAQHEPLLLAAPKRSLSAKRRKFIKVYIETGSSTEAAWQAYDCKDRDSAASLGYETLRKLDFAELMEQSGLSDHLLNRKLTEGLDSNKQLSARIVGKDADNRTDDFIEVPDYATRHKYLETALKLKKRLGIEQPMTFNADVMKVEFIAGDENQTP